MNEPTFSDLFRLACIDYSSIDWRKAFVDLWENEKSAADEMVAEMAASDDRIADLERQLAEAKAAPATLETVVADAARSLAELTGESCHVEVGAWYYPDHSTLPKLRITHTAYRSGQSLASCEGETIEEACTKIREDAGFRLGGEFGNLALAFLTLR